MGSTNYIPRLPQGGFDRTKAAHVSSPDTWFDLLNLRPVNGSLVQTPPLIARVTLSQFASEGTAQVRYVGLVEAVSGFLKYLVASEKNFRYVDASSFTQQYLPVVLTTTLSTSAAMLLFGINTTDFATDGDSFTVVLEAGTPPTTFKWKKNSGSFTTGVAIAPVVALGTNGLKVAFLTGAGSPTLVAGNTQVWTRSTLPTVNNLNDQQVRADYYQQDLYVSGFDRYIFRLRNDMVQQVGYYPVWGKYALVYYNHLIIGQYATSVSDFNTNAPDDAYNALVTPWTVGWSDLDNPDQTLATLNGEADSFVLPVGDATQGLPIGITGIGRLLNMVAIYLSDSIYSMNYVGLPNVMQIDMWRPGVGSIFQNGLVVTPQGHFFIGRDNIYHFNGFVLEKIGFPVINKLFDEFVVEGDGNYQKLYGHYDTEKAEVIWTYWTYVNSTLGYTQARQCIYQIDFKRFYFRNVPSPFTTAGAVAGMDLRSICPRFMFKRYLAYGGFQELVVDYVAGVDTLANSIPDVSFAVLSGSGTYTKPQAETQDILPGNDNFHLKQASSVAVDANYANNDGGVNVYFEGRNLTSTPSSPILTADSPWLTTTPERKLSLPQIAGNIFRYIFQFCGTKPVGCAFNGWGDKTGGGKSEQ